MKTYFLFLTLFSFQMLLAQPLDSKTVYLIPGTGANGQLFEKLQLEQYDTVHLEYLEPLEQENFTEYIDRMAAKIDTTQPYSIVGVSLGGMIATELADRLAPEEVIVIAGAKCQSELPNHYHLFRYLPLHRLMGGRSMIWGTKLMQPLFEPMNEEDKFVFKSMLNQKTPHFIKSAVRWMIDWDREEYRSDIVHIHGEKDHTLPFKNVAADYVLKDGGHMITYSRAEEISAILNDVLKEK